MMHVPELWDGTHNIYAASPTSNAHGKQSKLVTHHVTP